jgi:hypothetical protein
MATFIDHNGNRNQMSLLVILGYFFLLVSKPNVYKVPASLFSEFIITLHSLCH